MFERLGEVISKWWALLLVAWVGTFVALRIVAPSFDEIAKGGEFVFLPDKMPSRQAEHLLSRAFPGRQSTSNIVIVVHREDATGLTDDDRDFIHDELKPAIEQVCEHFKLETAADSSESAAVNRTGLISSIRDFTEPGIGELLISADKKASLITIEMVTDFQDSRNREVVEKVTEQVKRSQRGDKLPKGLQLAMTGSTLLGWDLSNAEATSARNIGPITIAMVVLLLAIIYRAPLLALVPLLTLFLAVDISLRTLTLLASAGYVPIFKGLQVYTTVITYGPGIDYCLFLIARYKENLQSCMPWPESLSRALGKVGSAITASAATVICGIGMLTFAEFGKFHDAGIGISIALIITLLATLTLTPSLLFLTGKWAFWPRFAGLGNCPNDSKSQMPERRNLFEPLWTAMGEVIERRPIQIMLLTFAIMFPFAGVGMMTYGSVNYGLFETLPRGTRSAEGVKVLEAHFPSGITGPINALLVNSRVDFHDDSGIAIVKGLSEKLLSRDDQLRIVDVRSAAFPLGVAAQDQDDSTEQESFVRRAVEHKNAQRRGVEHYVSNSSELAGRVTQLDIILQTNPFSLQSIAVLNRLEQVILEGLPEDQRLQSKISFLGPTASVRDVSTISRSDQRRIFLLVVSCVFLILIVLLRAFLVPLYLLITVLLSYIVTLGVTWSIFACLDPHGFIGLDWTVALFLFVVLIAVGEDYNIFLVTRVREEQMRSDEKQGIKVALARTGGIITSCGVIMAGTFVSLCFGSLARMQQLGFALAFGVILDTLVIRPILVPAFLMALNDERYGRLARYLK